MNHCLVITSFAEIWNNRGKRIANLTNKDVFRTCKTVMMDFFAKIVSTSAIKTCEQHWKIERNKLLHFLYNFNFPIFVN